VSASLFSSSWYKVADLKVRLRKHARIHRHVYRGKVWYVLQDHATGQFQRFTPQAYQVIGLLDGHKTLQQVWDAACASLGDGLPSQDEVIQLVAQLNKANVIQTDALPDIEQLQRRRREQDHGKFMQKIKSPLSIRIPLLDPEKFLDITMPWVRCIYSRFGAVLWLIIVMLGLSLAVLNWSALTDNLSDRLLALENLFLIALVYPVVKIFHELGHAYAVKRWGGEVHEMGVMLLVLFPVPYVDASAASAFRNKYQRMLVGAVGILAELLLAALAMIVWVLVEPGIVRAMAFNVMLIGGFSTLLFNGNPLLRFDAYYVLADYLEIPNLGSRGNNQVAYWTKRYLFGVSGLKTSAQSRSEASWLVGYASCAYVYRLFVMVAISLFVASQYFFVGILLACWSVWTSLLLPVIKMVAKPMSDPQLRRKRSRVIGVSSSLIALFAGLLFWLPVPYKTYTEGVLYLPQNAYVHALETGFVERVIAPYGKSVAAGELLMALRAPDLEARVKVLAAQLNEAKVRYQASIENRNSADILLQEFKFIEQEYLRANERLSGLQVRSKTSGEFMQPRMEGSLGRYVNRGDVLGYVVDYARLPLAVMVSEDNIDQVRNQTRQIELRFASAPDHAYQATILRQTPASTQQLPSIALSTQGGGRIALNPDRKNAFESFKGYFRIELSAPKNLKQRFDERVYVLFEHDPEPVIWRWYRSARRLLLRQFDV
jgi:putative peptide zinc metalloprotease protein